MIHRFVDLLAGSCSPAFALFEGSGGDSDVNVFRACNQAASQISDFNDGATTSEGVHNPIISPDGSKILFESANPSTGYTEIWVVSSAPGSTATLLLSDGSNYYMHPSWHPDSDQFLCVHGQSGAFDGKIVTSAVSTPGSESSALKTTDGTNSPYRPQFNFDASRIAYQWDLILGPGGSLRVMDDDGTNDAQLDASVDYRFQGAQFSWAHSHNKIAYDDGATSTNAAYVINDDGTGKTQINANGDAAGAAVRVSDRAWAPDDSYVVISSLLVSGQFLPVRAELDGSDTTMLDATNGGAATDYHRQVLVADGRVWMIQTGTTLSSIALAGGDYRVDLVTDGVILDSFNVSDGWYFN